ncbi:MAG: cyclic peptide export ABC transporter [Devosia sp.]
MKRILRVFLASRKRRAVFLLSFLVAAVGPSACLVLLTIVIKGLANDSVDYGTLWLFLVAASLSVSGLYLAVNQCGVIFETYLNRKRVALENTAASVDLYALDRVGRERIFEVVSREFQAASSASTRLPNLGVSASNLVLSCLVILLFAPRVLVLFVAIFTISMLVIIAFQKRAVRAIRRVKTVDSTHLGAFRQSIDGAKEIRLNEARRTDLFSNYIQPSANDVRSARIFETSGTARMVLIFNAISWLTLFLIVALLPIYVDDLAVVIQGLYVGIFVRTYLFAFALDVPLWNALNVALERIDALERDLKAAPREVADADEWDRDFSKIEIREAEFAYSGQSGEAGFSIGPLSLTIDRGETVFIVGSNGAGKSTFLRVLTRLYEPQSGQILVDGVPVTRERTGGYRALFASVFTDFHIFDRLYGLQGVQDADANALLADLGLSHVVHVSHGRFSSTDLSSGQRQRLALAVALLEDRPILVLDEIAADQDPLFRQRIYTELLPAWKRGGKTLVVVSHDDRFFGFADTLVMFEDGGVAVQHQGADDGR